MKRILFTALVAAVSVFAALQVQQKKEQVEVDKAQSARIHSEDHNAIQSLRLFAAGMHDEPISFGKINSRWWIQSPEEYPASNYDFDALLGQLGQLKAHRELELDESKLAAYGFSNPRYWLEYTSASSETVRYEWGVLNPVNNRWYFRSSARPESVFLVQAGPETILEKELINFRLRDLFWEFPQQVTRIETHYAEGVTVVAADLASDATTSAENSWTVGQMDVSMKSYAASTSPASESAVQRTIRAIRDLSASSFEPAAVDFNAKLHLRVYSEVAPIEISFAPDGEIYLAKVAGRDNIYRIPGYSVRSVFMPEKSYWARSVPSDP